MSECHGDEPEIEAEYREIQQACYDEQGDDLYFRENHGDDERY